MFKSLRFSVVVVVLALSGIVSAAPLGIGSTATPEMIAGWDIDIRPDGMGLPPGQGSVAAGEPLYEAKCASCHGLFGEGEGRWPVLAGGEGTLDTLHPEKTVGSYWPYASTLWDYIYRAMPYTAPQSLSNEEVYSIAAYVLYLNDIVEEDFVSNKETFARVKMPNEENFFIDNRPDVQNERCFKNCADPSTFEIVTTINGVTPTGHFKEDSGVAANHYEGNPSAASGSEKRIEKSVTKVALSNEALLGRGVYDKACQTCHNSGIAGAPKLGDVSSWVNRIGQGMDTLNDHAINGYQGADGVMPAKGGNMALSDNDVVNAVAYMVESSR
ncbi:MAG: c-type cytochrome [Pseudomonadota bacterium]|nr:c-type cytochrome [Pseudomonadota bacterium]